MTGLLADELLGSEITNTDELERFFILARRVWVRLEFPNTGYSYVLSLDGIESVVTEYADFQRIKQKHEPRLQKQFNGKTVYCSVKVKLN